MSMRMLFVGAGGVGGYFGARLVEAGADLSFLLRPARRAAVEAAGLRIESPHGNAVVHPRCVSEAELAPEYDLVVLAPKAYDLDAALASIEPALSPTTALLPLLNGMAHLALLDARYGPGRVLGGVAHIAGELGADGVVRQLTALHSLTVGGRDDATRALAARFVEQCRPACFDSVLADDIEAVMWEKWCFLAALAGITTLMHAPVGAIVATQSGDLLVRRLYAECLAIAGAAGKPVAAPRRDWALAILTEPGSAMTASMLRDLQAGARTEHEHILGELLRLAQAHRLDTPLLAVAHAQMQVRAGERSGA